MKKIINKAQCFLFLLIISCSDNFQEIFTVTDFSNAQKLESNFELEKGKNVERVKIHVKGAISDTIKLGRYFVVPSKVDTAFSHEWYSNEYFLEFNPYEAKSGNLTILIEFVVI